MAVLGLPHDPTSKVLENAGPADSSHPSTPSNTLNGAIASSTTLRLARFAGSLLTVIGVLAVLAFLGVSTPWLHARVSSYSFVVWVLAMFPTLILTLHAAAQSLIYLHRGPPREW